MNVSRDEEEAGLGIKIPTGAASDAPANATKVYATSADKIPADIVDMAAFDERLIHGDLRCMPIGEGALSILCNCLRL